MRTREQIEIAYANELDELEKKRLELESYRYTAWFWTDMLLSPYLMRRQRYRDCVDDSEALKALDELGAIKETGVVIASSHQGAADVMTLSLGFKGYPISIITRPLDNQHLDKLVNKKRVAYNRTTISKTGAMRPAYRCLANKGIAALLIDQDAGQEGIFVPFFGEMASTHKGGATLSLMSKAPVVMMFCLRDKPREFSYKVHVAPPLSIPEGEASEENIAKLSEEMTLVVENYIRRFPEQNMWVHRRWKTRPPEETDRF